MALLKWFKTSKPKDPLSELLGQSKRTFDEKWEKAATNKGSSNLSNYELIRILGKGKYGRVIFAKIIKNYATSPDVEYVAIKMMQKRVVVADNATKHIIQEKRILQTLDYPFLLKYKDHFKDFANLYLVTEFLAGADIYRHLRKKGHFEENVVIFYVAQIVLAFEYLHYVGIVYRDLKPENVAVGPTGYVKLIDFGLSKKIDANKTRSLCGTPEYVAPEIIKNQPYSFGVDWWALGIFTYELLHGKTPFHSRNVMQTLDRIIKNDIKFYMPFKRQEVTISFMRNLLQTNVKNRLQTAVAVKNHKYFGIVQWQSIYNRTMPVPYKPAMFEVPPPGTHDPDINIEQSNEELYKEEFQDF